MAKTKISEFDIDPSNNTDINSINIAEGCAPSGINNAIRQLMSDLKEFQTGAADDNFTVGGNLTVDGTSTLTGNATFAGTVTVNGSTLGNMANQAKSAVDITGGTIVGITDLAVADGGTGSSTLAANAVLLGNGTSALQTVAPSTSGNVLTSNGTTWTSAAPATPFAWNVTYTSVSKSAGDTYTLPSNCIGVYIWCKVYGGGNNGGIGKIDVKNSGGSTLGTMFINGTNIGGGADGGSGMSDGAGSFVPVSSSASSLYFYTETNNVGADFLIQAYVAKS